MNERHSVSELEPEAELGTDRLLVCNPASGAGDHAPGIRARATKRGFEVRETEAAGDACRFAREAAARGDGEDVFLIDVAGGDGTVIEGIHGLLEADALDWWCRRYRVP